MAPPVLIADALDALAVQFAAFEALLLLTSAVHKSIRWRHLRDVVRQFAGVRPSLATPVLGCVVILEVAAGGALFIPRFRSIGAVLAASIWAVYWVLILRAIAQGRRDADCGCTFGPTRRPLDTYQVSRNLVLLALATWVAVDFQAGNGSSGGGLQGSQLLAAFALLTLYGALDQVMALGPLRSGELS